MAQHILVLHGPNLNLLGSREPDVYGSDTLSDINQRLQAIATQEDAHCSVYQSNHEGDLVDRIQAAAHDQTDFIIINAAAYTHTSIALRDALAAVRIPFIDSALLRAWAFLATKRRYATPWPNGHSIRCKTRNPFFTYFALARRLVAEQCHGMLVWT